jgi:hypothetical protein
MASFVMNTAAREISDGTIDLVADTIKVMLVTSAYTPDRDDTSVTAAAAAELTVGGYVGGYNGAGRKALASKAFATDLVNDRAEWSAANVTWTALGAGETIAGAVLIKEITNDAGSRPIAYLGLTATPTDGQDVTLTVDAQGLVQWSTV